MSNAKINNDNSVVRWRPDFRYVDDKFDKITQDLFESTDPSDTDKEAYRVTLASLRGELAQGVGKPDVGSYSLKAGEEYDPNNDFSFLNRKDLTIVELDEYINQYKHELEKSDAELSEQILSKLAKAELMKQNLQKGIEKNTDVKE